MTFRQLVEKLEHAAIYLWNCFGGFPSDKVDYSMVKKFCGVIQSLLDKQSDEPSNFEPMRNRVKDALEVCIDPAVDGDNCYALVDQLSEELQEVFLCNTKEEMDSCLESINRHNYQSQLRTSHFRRVVPLGLPPWWCVDSSSWIA